MLDVRDVRFWSLDEETAVGSLVAIVRADADPQLALRHVHRAFDGVLSELTVQVEKEDDDGWADIG